MADIILLELLAIISLFYSLLLLFVSFAPVGETFLIFIWTIAVSMLFALGIRKSRLWELSILLLLLPLVIYHGEVAIYFLLGTTAIIYVYAKTSLLRGSYKKYADNLKKTALFFMLAAYFRSLPHIPFTGSMVKAAPFVLVYFFSSVVLIRSIRHLDSGMEHKKIKRANIRYIVIMIFLSTLAAFESVRDYVISLCKKIPNLVIYPVYWLSNLVHELIEMLPTPKIPWKLPPPLETEELQPTPEQIEEMLERGEAAPVETPLMNTIVGILLIIVFIYLLYSILKKAGNRKYVGLEYVEEREYIKRPPKKKKKKSPRDKFPLNLGDQIRYYYRRYLDKLAKKNIPILKSDTSLEVNEKAEAVLASGNERIREIYIENRYGEREVDEGTVAEMEKLCRGI